MRAHDRDLTEMGSAYGSQRKRAEQAEGRAGHLREPHAEGLRGLSDEGEGEQRACWSPGILGVSRWVLRGEAREQGKGLITQGAPE